MLPRRWRAGDLPYLLLAAACVIPLYWPSLRYDLFQDDYHFLRPWPPDHLVGAWRGGWSIPEIQDYYRPLAIWLYKALFYPFGLNTRVLHLLPFLVLITLAWMVGRFVRRESASVWLGAAAVGLTVVHPMVTVAAGAWVSNQYQALVGIGMMATLLWWQTCRDRHWIWWWPMLVPIVAASFTKETGLMIPVIVVAIHSGRAAFVRDLAWPSCRWCLPALFGGFVALNAWRFWMLGGAGGNDDMSFASSINQWFLSLWATLIEPVRLVEVPQTKWLFAVPAALAAATALWALLRRTSTAAATLALEGIVILSLLSVPTALVFSRERLMPHPIGAVLLMVAALAAVAQSPRWVRWLAGATTVMGLSGALMLTTRALTFFEPCRSAQVSDPESLLTEDRTIPPEMVRWLKGLQRNGCDSATHAPLFRATQRLTWGVIERDGDEPVFRRRHVWLRPRVVALLDQRAVQVVLRLRHPLASTANPIPVHIVADGGAEFSVELISPEWREVPIPLARTLLTWTRQMHRLELKVPSDFVPGVEMRPLDLIYPQ